MVKKAKPKGKIAQKGPIEVKLEAGKTYFWCSCGLSKNQPFCDKSHNKDLFVPMAFTPPESGKYFLCACKQTTNEPYCDSSHAEL
ncbi:MAG: CDGSH iron-sulfur domain-containing protein [Pseudomonadota bacterium]